MEAPLSPASLPTSCPSCPQPGAVREIGLELGAPRTQSALPPLPHAGPLRRRWHQIRLAHRVLAPARPAAGVAFIGFIGSPWSRGPLPGA